MEPAILLCRISDLKQNDGYSLDAQEKHGRLYCETNALSIIKEFSFIETASKSGKRNIFQEVVKLLKKEVLRSRTCIHLVTEKPDRLSRNFSSKEDIQLLVMSGKLKVHYYKDRRIFDSNCTPADIFNDDIQTAVSKYHAMNLSRESKKGMEEKASQGWLPARAPYGYINYRERSTNGNNRGVSTIIPDPNKIMVQLIQRIYELRATLNMSFQGILATVTEENLIPPGKTLSKTGIEGILMNKFYGGIIVWDGKEYQGKHELIVPRRHFKAVHDIDKRSYTGKAPGLFSGFLKCSNKECGCHILYDPKIKNLRTTGEEKMYHYYHCSDGKGIHRMSGIKQKNLSEEKLLELFEEPIREISITQELADAVSRALKKTHEKAVTAHKRNMEGYRVAIKQTELEEDKAYELLVTSVIDQDMYHRQIDSIRSKKRKYEDLLEEGQVLITAKFYETSEFILELAKDAESLWKKRSNEEKLKLLKLILSNQTLKADVDEFKSKSVTKPSNKILNA